MSATLGAAHHASNVVPIGGLAPIFEASDDESSTTLEHHSAEYAEDDEATMALSTPRFSTDNLTDSTDETAQKDMYLHQRNIVLQKRENQEYHQQEPKHEERATQEPKHEERATQEQQQQQKARPQQQQQQSSEFIGGATRTELEALRHSALFAPLVAPSDLGRFADGAHDMQTSIMSPSSASQDALANYRTVERTSAKNKSFAPQSNSGAGNARGAADSQLTASHALFVSTASDSAGARPSPPPLCVAAPTTASGTLRNLDLIGDAQTQVNFLLYWINRECHWQSPDHARCVRQRLSHIADYAARSQQAFLEAEAEQGLPAAQLARYATLFAESQRSAQHLLQKIGDGTHGARLKRAILDFPTLIGTQYVARYLLAQPDWNTLSDAYKSIIVQSDWESIDDDARLVTPERMIAHMSNVGHFMS